MHFFKTSFKNLPIQRKVGLAILLTCSTALAVTALAILLVQAATFRRTFSRDLEAIGQIIGNNSTAALTFRDNKTAEEILAALKAKSYILQAVIELPDGSEFATFKSRNLNLGLPGPRADGFHFIGPYLVLTQPIALARERIGTLHLVSDYSREYRSWLHLYATVLGAVLVISILLTLALAAGLQHLISAPILALAEVAQSVAEKKDYSVRGRKVAQDEVGRLTDAFNEMLAKIASDDAVLRETNDALQLEINERKQTQQEVEKLHKELIVTSRAAGMSEVATGVLHNVGNVLNSVNVSVNLVKERLQRSPLSNLTKVCAMLDRHRADLGAFLTTDPKGKLLPEFISQLGAVQEEEKRELQSEMQALSKNVQHIKEIVAMQQSYAKVAGVLEDLPPTCLLDDALRMNAGAFLRHGITVCKDYREVPPVRVDKHKVLQILINLLSNAKYAMEAADRQDRILKLGVTMNGTERVQMLVRDNGVGIAQENLTRIFGHGFTTKRNGHGFGLHSGALAAKEMGGTLQALSDGPGTGATFILELPTAASQGTHHE